MDLAAPAKATGTRRIRMPAAATFATTSAIKAQAVWQSDVLEINAATVI